MRKLFTFTPEMNFKSTNLKHISDYMETGVSGKPEIPKQTLQTKNPLTVRPKLQIRVLVAFI